MDLQLLGLTASLAEAFGPYARDGFTAGRVVSAHTHVYRVLTEAGEMLAEVSGRLRHEAAGPRDFPAVGDWVVLQARPEGGRAVIHGILPRRSRFSRKVAGSATEEQVVAANVDSVFLVAGLDGDFSPRRLERALVLAWESGARPVVVLNKADLGVGEERRREAAAAAPGVPVHAVSARTGDGLGALEAYLGSGQTVALLGSSGVGKSTLVNRLLGGGVQPTAEVRAGDDRGRHTTTHRELIVLPGSGMIVDTPGLREIQLWGGEEGLGEAFTDVGDLAAACRFRDCRHEGEPGCAVLEALSEGRLAAERLASYRKLGAEQRSFALRHDQKLQQAEKRRWRSIHRLARRHRPRG
jgi:ribosome biogenesis GTPase